MFYIGIADILCMFVNGLFTGIFAITGAVFCSHPTFIYLAGTIGLGIYCYIWVGTTVETLSFKIFAYNNKIFEKFFFPILKSNFYSISIKNFLRIADVICIFFGIKPIT